MRRIDLSNYMEKVTDADSGKDVELPYPVKDNMIELLLSRQLGLSAREALERDILARKIRGCSNGSILLEQADYQKLVDAADTITGWARTDIQFLKRILEAPEVEVEEKQPKKEVPTQ